MLEHREKEASIHDAAKQGDLKQIQQILSADPRAYLIRNEYGELAISVVAHKCHTEVVCCFLQHAAQHGYQYRVYDALVWFQGSVNHDDKFELLTDIIQKNRSLFSDHLPESHFQAIVGNQQYFETDPTRWYETNDMGITAAFFNIILGHRDLKTFTNEIIVSPRKKDLTDTEKRELSQYYFNLAKLYGKHKNTENQKVYFHKAIAMREQINDPQDFDWRILARYQMELKIIWWDCKMFSTSAEHIAKSIEFIEKIKNKGDYDWYNLALCHLNLAIFNKNEKRDEVAKRNLKDEEHLLKAIALHENIQSVQDSNWRLLALCHHQLSQCYRSQNKQNIVKEHLDKAIASRKKIVKMEDVDWDQLRLYQTNLAIYYSVQSKEETAKEMAEVFFREAIRSIDNIKDENMKALRLLPSLEKLAVHLSDFMNKDVESAQLLLKGLKARNILLAKKVEVEKTTSNFDALIRIAISNMLDKNMFDEAARCFMEFMEIYYLCTDAPNKSKRNLNKRPKINAFSFLNNYLSALARYESLYAYKKTYANLLDLMARMFKTVEEGEPIELWPEILIILNNDIHLTQPSIRSALTLFCKLLRFTVEHAQDENCRGLINPAIQSHCDTDAEKDNVLNLITNLEEKLHASFNLNEYIICTVLNENAELKAENEDLKQDLRELKQEYADRSPVTKHGIFSTSPKRERDEPEEEQQHEDEQSKRIKVEPHQEPK